MLLNIRLRLKKTPMGTMARRYTRPVIGTFFRESSIVVKRASSWVMTVAKTRCHVVREMAASVSMGGARRRGRTKSCRRQSINHNFLRGDAPNFFRSRIHLLNMMTDELRPIQTLRAVRLAGPAARHSRDVEGRGQGGFRRGRRHGDGLRQRLGGDVRAVLLAGVADLLLRHGDGWEERQEWVVRGEMPWAERLARLDVSGGR